MTTKIAKLKQNAKAAGVILLAGVSLFMGKMLNAQEPINSALVYPGKNKTANIKIDDNSSVKLQGEVTEKGEFKAEKATFTQEVYYYGEGSEKNKTTIFGYPVEITSVSNDTYSINYVSTDEEGYIWYGNFIDGQSAYGAKNSNPDINDAELAKYTVSITHSLQIGRAHV